MFDDLLPESPRLDQPRVLIVVGPGEEDDAADAYGDLEEME